MEANDVTHVAVLASNGARRRQIEYLDARLVGRVLVRSVRSRTRGELSTEREMVVYAVAETR